MKQTAVIQSQNKKKYSYWLENIISIDKRMIAQRSKLFDVSQVRDLLENFQSAN